MSATSSSALSLASNLRSLCDKKLSGTLFITTDSGRKAYVSVRGGEIIALGYANKRGRDVLPLLSQLAAKNVALVEGYTMADNDLLSTDEVLSRLGADSRAPTVEDRECSATTEALSESTKRALEDTLADFMGPVATFICNQTFQETDDLESALERMMREIPDNNQALLFKAQAQAALRHVSL